MKAQVRPLAPATAVAATIILLLGALPCPVGAQVRRNPAVARAQAAGQRVLGEWIVTRYRGSIFSVDSSSAGHGSAVSNSAPRVESALGSRGDTLVALHFSAIPLAAPLEAAGSVKFASPSGAVTSITGTIVARRPFRAPRTPAAVEGSAADWRHVWAYLIVVPRNIGAIQATSMRGWLVLDASPKAPKKGGR